MLQDVGTVLPVIARVIQREQDVARWKGDDFTFNFLPTNECYKMITVLRYEQIMEKGNPNGLSEDGVLNAS